MSDKLPNRAFSEALTDDLSRLIPAVSKRSLAKAIRDRLGITLSPGMERDVVNNWLAGQLPRGARGPFSREIILQTVQAAVDSLYAQDGRADLGRPRDYLAFLVPAHDAGEPVSEPVVESGDGGTDGGIWGVLRSKARRADLRAIRKLVEWAESTLQGAQNLGSSNTWQDGQHPRRLIAGMEMVLGECLEDLAGMEAALLVLAAHLHDLGMAYTPAEISEISVNPDFLEFLDGQPELYVAVQVNGGVVTPDVIELYCLGRQESRIREHLDDLDLEQVSWNDVAIVEPLLALCRCIAGGLAHLWQHKYGALEDGEADLRTCGVLLRLAELLNISQTNSPELVRQHLRADPTHKRRAVLSGAEWASHARVTAFLFPQDPRTDRYDVTCKARPTHPAAEFELRTYLEHLRNEFETCRALRDHSRRWRELPLPGGIEADIRSFGYRYGEFHFELDREALLTLFAGKELYGDATVFIRELLQNAFDAVRLYRHLHSPDARDPDRVDISYWEDDDGRVWVRFDDTGSGMDEDLLRRYFLKVGRSYYKSADLRADLLRSRSGGAEFGAISKFGIGILSCFLAGDRVEVSTRRRFADGRTAEPVRLSMARNTEYFILQDRETRATPMPGRLPNDRERLRRRHGTSIAVRLDPRTCDLTRDELGAALARFIFAPPVAVTLNQQPVGAETSALVEKPWLAEPLVFPISNEDRVGPTSLLRLNSYSLLDHEVRSVPFLGPVTLTLLPLDLSGHSLTRNLRGQAAVIDVTSPLQDGTHGDIFAGWPSGAAIDAVRPILVGRTGPLSISAQVGGDQVGFAVAVTVDESALDSAISELTRLAADEKPSPLASGLAISDTRQIAKSPHLLLRILRANRRDDHHSGIGLREEGSSLRAWFTLPSTALPDPRILSRMIGTTPRWGYGGIAMPSTDFKHDKHSGFRARLWPETPWTTVTNGAGVWGALDLSGHLLPDLNVARDRVSGLPLALHLHAQAALWRAASAYDRTEFKAIADKFKRYSLFGIPPTGERAMRDLLLDDETWSFWRNVPLIHCEVGLSEDFAVSRQYFGPATVDEVRAEARRGSQLFLTSILSWGLVALRWREAERRDHLSDVLSAALIQLFLPLEVVAKERRGHALMVSDSGEMAPLSGLSCFPPLWFVPYRASDEIFQFYNAPANLNHQIGSWCRENAETLR